jgi:hypothetical protein
MQKNTTNCRGPSPAVSCNNFGKRAGRLFDMNTKDILGIMVRGFALYIAWDGFYDMWSSGLIAAHIIIDPKVPASVHFIFGGFRLIAACVIIKFADYLVDFAYIQKKQ